MSHHRGSQLHNGPQWYDPNKTQDGQRAETFYGPTDPFGPMSQQRPLNYRPPPHRVLQPPLQGPPYRQSPEPIQPQPAFYQVTPGPTMGGGQGPVMQAPAYLGGGVPHAYPMGVPSRPVGMPSRPMSVSPPAVSEMYQAQSMPFQPLNPPTVLTDPFGNGPSQNSNVPARDFVESKEAFEDAPLDEPPLLEELGVYPMDILRRISCVMFFRELQQDMIAHLDLTGPIAILLSLASTLLLAGKVHFGYLYALSTCGSLGLWALLNVMSKAEMIDVYKTLSILGYSLLPLLFLSISAIFYPLRSRVGMWMSLGIILWCTSTASRFFEEALLLKNQRFLVAYPIFLFYASFVLLTVF